MLRVHQYGCNLRKHYGNIEEYRENGIISDVNKENVYCVSFVHITFAIIADNDL